MSTRQRKQINTFCLLLYEPFLAFLPLLQSQTTLGLIGKSEADVLNRLPCGGSEVLNIAPGLKGAYAK